MSEIRQPRFLNLFYVSSRMRGVRNVVQQTDRKVYRNRRRLGDRIYGRLPASAATYDWATAGEFNWNLPGSWTPGGGPPLITDVANVDNNGIADVTDQEYAGTLNLVQLPEVI